LGKAPEAFRTISEVADELDVPKHVLRFWETKFTHVKPMKRGGGRRYYRPEDVELLRGIRTLLHDEGYTIRGLQRVFRQQGVNYVKTYARDAGPDSSGAAGTSLPDLAGEAAGHARKAAIERARAAPKRRQRNTSSQTDPSENSGPAQGEQTTPEPLTPAQRGVLSEALRELQHCRALLATVPEPAA